MTDLISGVRIQGAERGQGEPHQVFDPATGRAFAEVRFGTAADADDALAAATDSFGGWAAAAARDRAGALRAIAAELRTAADGDWADLITRETGKRRAESVAELNLSAVYADVFADLAEQDADEEFQAVQGIRHQVGPRPLGPVAVFTPWNFPVSIPIRKLAPLLAAGCTAVFKPSELAPLAGLRLAELLERHLPAGVVNTVVGTPEEVADRWLTDPRVEGVSFTGSTRVGAVVATALAPRFLPAVLELGGCAPFIVLPDADLDAAVQTLLVAKFRNNGQSCIAANQVFVANRVAEDFLERLAAATARLQIGDPMAAGTDLGPVAPSGDVARIRRLVDDAVAAGGRALVEPGELPREGHYLSPQFVIDPPAETDLFATEVFGPASGIRRFDDVSEAIEVHHRTGYGLAGYVCGSDRDTMQAVAAQLRAGVIGLNTGTPNYPGAPFGGVGLSGLGYEGGRRGLDAFRSYTTVASAD